MMPQAYVHPCMHAEEEVRVREGESMSSSAQLPSHCRQGFVLLLAICACGATQSSGAQHHQLAYRCQNAAFLTLPLCDEEFTSLGRGFVVLYEPNQPPTAGCRSPERVRCVSAISER